MIKIGTHNEAAAFFKKSGFAKNYLKGIHYNADIFGCEVHADFTDKANLFTLNVKIGELHTVKEYLTGDENDVFVFIQDFINSNREAFVKVRESKRVEGCVAADLAPKKVKK